MSEHLEHLLSEYIDEELDSVRHHMVERHLAECPSCRKLWLEMLAVQTGVKSHFAAISAPDGLQAAIMGRLEAMPAVDAPTAVESSGVGVLKGLISVLVIISLVFMFLLKDFVAGSMRFGLSLLHAGVVLLTSFPYVTESIVLFVLVTISLSSFSLFRAFRAKLN